MAFDPFTALVLGGVGNAFLQSFLAQQAGTPQMPEGPSYTPPLFGPLRQQTRFNDWTYNNRLKMLQDFYGGKMTTDKMGAPREPNFIFKGEDMGGQFTGAGPFFARRYEENPAWLGGSGGLGDFPDASQKHLAFTGDKPAAEWLHGQGQILRDSRENFRPETNAYFKERGIDATSNSSGAQSAMKDDYQQMRRELVANAQNIRANTLGSLFGEVSDAAAAGGNAAAVVGQTTQAANQAADQRYNDMMQLWQTQQANQQPGFWQTLAGMGGQMLPYALMGGGGSSAAAGGGGPYAPAFQPDIIPTPYPQIPYRY